MKYFALFITLVLLSVNAEEIELKVTSNIPLGTICYASETFEFSWNIHKGTKILSQKSTENVCESFSVFISEVSGETKVFQVPVTKSTFSWQVPVVPKNSIFLIHVDAIPKIQNFPRLRGSISVYVAPPKNILDLPKEFNDHLKVLMDWKGKRGYYKEMDSQSALLYAQKTCESLRRNFSPDSYLEYLTVVEDIEFKETAKMTVFSKEKRAKLYIDNTIIGFFEQWDSKEQAFYLEVRLPVTTDLPYNIRVEKDDLIYRNVQLHPGESSHIVSNLHKEIAITITSNLEFRIFSQKEKTTWSQQHTIICNQGEIQIWDLEIKENNYKTKIYFTVTSKQAWKLTKEDNFYLFTPENRYTITNNGTINLIDFEK